jgi:hypothetical protein
MATRAHRSRRPPNREPTSLAAVTITSDCEATIDTVGALDANIDPALQTYEIDDPPSLQLPSSLDPDYDNIYHLDDFQYPSPTLPRSPEASWPSTPPPPPPLASLPPLPLVSNIQPGKALRWTFEMEEILFQTLLEQVENGKRAENGFKSDAWTACVDAIIARTAHCQGVVTTDKCKSKMEAMKALWRELNWLKDQSGFGWDEATGLV